MFKCLNILDGIVESKCLSNCQNNPPVAGPPRKSKKSHADDEEILSDASDVEGRPNGDAGYESVDDGDRDGAGGDDLRETAEEKAAPTRQTARRSPLARSPDRGRRCSA